MTHQHPDPMSELNEMNRQRPNHPGVSSAMSHWVQPWVNKQYRSQTPQNSLSISLQRRIVGDLLDHMLNDSLTPQQVLQRWPVSYQVSDLERDPSLYAAFQAVWYFEADEDRRFQEMFYADLQWALLEQMIGYFKKSDPLPHNLLSVYSPVEPKFYQAQQLFWQPLRVWKDNLEQFLGTIHQGFCRFRNTWRDAWRLLPIKSQ
ncbi:MAG: hypothetical protein K2X01_09015 [Cyanobacteria bacterium]|nr:hypothetical protein [Cyanobacteriota bacterium]